MYEQAANNLIEHISSFGFGVFNNPDGSFSIANPLDNEDGFYLNGSDLPSLLIDTAEYIGFDTLI